MMVQQLNMFGDKSGIPSRVGKASVKPSNSDALRYGTGFLSAYDWVLNAYVGCTFSCQYCYAASFVADADERADWGNWVRYKERAVANVKSKSDKIFGKSIYMSSATDPYQPLERKLEFTRKILEVLVPLQPRLVVQTRSPDVVRDIDLYQKIRENGGSVQVNMTVTTTDDDVRRIFEGSCPTYERRLSGIAEVTAAGIETCITLTPFLMALDVDDLLDKLFVTGVKNYIIAAFRQSPGKFSAKTDSSVLDTVGKLLAEHDLEYNQHYNFVRNKLVERAYFERATVGEGKDGFSSPAL